MLAIVLVGIGSFILILMIDAVVLDSHGFIGALGMAWRLVRGNFVPVLLMLLISAGLVLLNLELIQMLGNPISEVVHRVVTPTVMANPLDWLVRSVISAPFTTFSILLWTLFYLDRRPLAEATEIYTDTMPPLPQPDS